ncbi:ATP-dependent DNA ligase [Streptomyces dioscori]|uniref:ATP-dependent DNA ligase n=1 Tax=Streptomyces dioscori TaxID=2109333 RepID=A0A2P8QA41_9ACTN|nr:non-homologous end-joining DNA ligase [Streptomyces dioscori]PSM43121.1 ATP-dependent DNA ligase [Streptomyces dioscori]
MTAVRAGRRTVEVHRPDKVMFPAGSGGSGGPGGGEAKEYTKADVVAYYREIAPFMLPHLRGRPLMLERYPDGLDGPKFMQKNVQNHYPDWIRRVEVPKEGGTVLHPVCDDTATLVYLADQAALTLHRWLARVSSDGTADRPDRLVFDLDPSTDDFEPVRDTARLLGELLDHLRLPSALMTTGSRGLHVVVPLDGRHGFDEVHTFAKDVADTLTEAHPDRLTTEARKKDRGDRLYLDIQRNAYAQTTVAPFTVRARPGAPVAMPVAWDQLEDAELGPRRWTIADAVDQARTNPWSGLLRSGRALGPARRRLNALRG